MSKKKGKKFVERRSSNNIEREEQENMQLMMNNNFSNRNFKFPQQHVEGNQTAVEQFDVIKTNTRS
jgi:hypothetical protein